MGFRFHTAGAIAPISTQREAVTLNAIQNIPTLVKTARKCHASETEKLPLSENGATK